MSDYNRAGIFIDEQNNSVVDKPAAQQAVINFIPGFSKKGKVFNRPVLVTTKSDRSTYFGDIDRNLEKKGSYFHRTLDVAIQTAPIWALNILKTSSLDTLNYASVSVSAQYDNDAVTTRLYDDFFNKSGFWQRDTESFLFFARNSQRMIHFTNVSDKKITIFMFKSALAGYDTTAEVWFGGKDKMPQWMNPTDFISDYMVRVVAVVGDWSNYTTLASDSNWSKYFAASGLRSSKVNNFIKDNGVALLGDYNGSLIPFFRDNKNNNIFIETLINLETDKTGLFCAYDIDNVETDFPTGNVDVIGNTLVTAGKSKINFMSYKDTIEVTDTFTDTPLDTLANVIGVGTTAARTTANTNGTLASLTIATTGGGFATDVNPVVTTTSITGGAIINNLLVPVITTVTTLAVIAAPALLTNYRIDTIYVDSTGLVKVAYGTVANLANSLSEVNAVAAGLTYPASMANNAIILGYVFRTIDNSAAITNTFVSVALNGSGFVPLVVGSTGTDILVTGSGSNAILTFVGTATATKANYEAYRRLTFFNELVTKKVLTNSVIIDSAGAKVDLSTATWIDNYSAGSGDKYINLTVAAGNIYTATAGSGVNGTLTFYYNDNEFVMNTKGLETRTTITGTSGYGVAAKNSKIYQDFYNGMINTGDYFFIKKAVTTSLKFVHFTDTNYPNAIGDYIVMSAADAAALGIGVGANNFHLIIESHPVNAGDFLLTTGEDNAGSTFAPGLVADGLLAGGGEVAFLVNNLVSTYSTLQTIDVFDYDAKVYLKMYFAGSTVKIQFMADNTLITQYTINGGLLSINKTINVYSGEAAYEQTLEIEQHSSYTITDTKVLIDMVRYPEVIVGNYVKAYFDPTLLQPGEYPKQFARIIKKAPWSGNSQYDVSYAEITTDIKIDISTYNGDLQTTRYTKIEDYISTYKAITMNGYAPQATSLPDGTETRQSDILDIIGKDTALFYAITNKNKFNFRYLIDSFGLGLTEFSKQQLVDITGKRKNCISFINMPSVKTFKGSSNPSFINADGTLNLGYVKDGGNLEQNPAFLYSFAQGEGKTDGRDTAGYFFPYATVNDNGRPMIFPPAAYCANTYMRKLNSSISGIYNWTVAAGITDGKILGISDVEMDFTASDDVLNPGDLENLYAMGANPIMYAKNTGFYIETEWTALTSPLSALSYLHVREILIDLENELYAMLIKYQWKFNTPAIRAKIKREADEICQRYVDRSALNAFENIIDETNNTPTLIDNQFGLLTTNIEPIHAMGIIVNVISVMGTGQLGTSSGFTA